MKRQEMALERPWPGDSGFDYLAVVDSLLDHKRLIAVTAVIMFLIGCAYAFLAPPVYEADVLIKVSDSDPMQQQAADSLSYYVAPAFSDRGTADSEIQVLGSRRIVSEAVSNQKLYIRAKPDYFPLIGAVIARQSDDLSSPGLFGMGHYVWGTEHIEMGAFDVPAKYEGKKYRVRALGNARYELEGPGLASPHAGQTGITDRIDTPAGPITVRVDAIHSNPGGQFTLVRDNEPLVVDALQKKLKIVEAGTKTNVIKLSLQGEDPATLAATTNVISDLYVTWNKERKARIAEDALSHIRQTIPELENQTRTSEAAYNNYRGSGGLLDAAEEERMIINRIADNEATLLTLNRTRQELSATLADTNPKVIAVDKQIQSTQREIDRLKQRVHALPQTEQGAMQLMRNAHVNADLVQSMRKYVEELQLVSAGKTGTAEIVDPAVVPTLPVRPLKLLVMLGSLVAGAIVGAAIAAVWDLLHRGVTDTDGIESSTGLSVYATIPLSERQQEIMNRAERGLPQQLPLSLCYPRDPAVESIRMLRSALQVELLGAPNNVVMLAGPLPGIGKSFLTANLAVVLAAGAKRVLVVDGDLRKGQLCHYLGAQRGPGLSEVLQGLASFDDVLTLNVAPGLDLLQTGSYPTGGASELLLSERFDACIAEASRQYDIVLIDAPAVLAVSDAGVLARAAGSVLLVARFGETLSSEIDASIKRLAQAGARIRGIVLNSVRVRSSRYEMARRYGTHAYVASHYDV